MKKRLGWSAAWLTLFLGYWLLASAASWRPHRLAHLPGARNSVSRFEVSPSQDLVLLANGSPTVKRWRVFRLSTGKMIWDRTTALWEAFALRPDETGFVALELQPAHTSSQNEIFYRPIFGDFATQSQRRGSMIALKDPNVATNLAFSPDGQAVYGLFVRDGAQWNLEDGQLRRRIAVGDPWSDEHYVSAFNCATLDFLPDRTIYAQATNEQLSFWDFQTGRKLLQVPPLPKEQPLPERDSDYVWFSQHQISFRSQILAIVRPYLSPLLVVYDLRTGHALWRQTLSVGFSACFLALDGQTLVCVANNQLQLRAARTGRLLRHFPAPGQIVDAQNKGDFFFYLDGNFDLIRQRLR